MNTRYLNENISTYRFGLEMEYVGVRYYNVYDSYGPLPAGWVCVEDGSVYEGGEFRFTGNGFMFEEALQRMEALTSWAKDKDIHGDVHAGLHIHVSVPGLTDEYSPARRAFLRTLAENWNRVSRLVMGAMPPDHERQDYCSRETSLYTPDSWENASYSRWADPCGHRYQALNLTSIRQHQTVEFRLFNSTMDAQQVQAAMMLCGAFVHHAVKNLRLGANASTFEQVLEQLDLEKADRVVLMTGWTNKPEPRVVKPNITMANELMGTARQFLSQYESESSEALVNAIAHMMARAAFCAMSGDELVYLEHSQRPAQVYLRTRRCWDQPHHAPRLWGYQDRRNTDEWGDCNIIDHTAIHDLYINLMMGSGCTLGYHDCGCAHF